VKKTKATSADSERPLSESTPQDQGLSHMEPHLRALKRLGQGVPTEEQVERFALAAARLVPPPGPRPAVPFPVGAAARIRPSRLSLRLAGAAAALILMLGASAGVAYAADRAAPGDALYGLDRALEDIGLGDGELQERLTEASQLVERGRIQEGLALAGVALAAVSDDSGPLQAAAAALQAAADAAASDPSARTPEARGVAAQKLRWLATAEPSAREFVQTVNDLASSISHAGQGDSGDEPEGSTTGAMPGNDEDQSVTETTGNRGGGNGPRR
jgi:hypothetical protein